MHTVHMTVQIAPAPNHSSGFDSFPSFPPPHLYESDWCYETNIAATMPGNVLIQCRVIINRTENSSHSQEVSPYWAFLWSPSTHSCDDFQRLQSSSLTLILQLWPSHFRSNFPTDSSTSAHASSQRMSYDYHQGSPQRLGTLRAKWNHELEQNIMTNSLFHPSPVSITNGHCIAWRT